MTLIDIARINTSGGTQTRAMTDTATVREYADAMLAGATFPPVVVYFDGTDHWLADGFHRWAAAQLISETAGQTQIDALIRQGTQRDAVLHSVGANATHGLKRTNDDKRRAVETLLLDAEWGQWSDREIARRCGVSNSMVSDLRKELAETNPTVAHLQSTIRKGADGRVIDTANIGQAESGAAETEAPKHWSDSAYHADAFWSSVSRFHFDPATILQTLQPGATRLGDLALTFDEARSRLLDLSAARIAAAFPAGSLVIEAATGRVGTVRDSNSDHLHVRDIDPNALGLHYWPPIHCRPATEAEADAYRKKAAEEAEKRKAAHVEASATGSARPLDKALVMPDETIRPGDLVQYTDPVDEVREIGQVVASERGYGGRTTLLCRVPTYDAGRFETASWPRDRVTVVEAWADGQPMPDLNPLPEPAWPPKPWAIDEDDDLVDATGAEVEIGAQYGDRGLGLLTARRIVALVNCPASAYTGDESLAGSLDRLLGALSEGKVYEHMHADMQSALAYLAPMAVQLGFELTWLPPAQPVDSGPTPLERLIAEKEAAKEAEKEAEKEAASPAPVAPAEPAPAESPANPPTEHHGVLKSADDPFEKGDWVLTLSGHRGIVTGDRGNALMVETVNGEREYKRGHLVHRRTIRFQPGDEVRDPRTRNWGTFIRLDGTTAIVRYKGTEYEAPVYELELVRRAMTQPATEPI